MMALRYTLLTCFCHKVHFRRTVFFIRVLVINWDCSTKSIEGGQPVRIVELTDLEPRVTSIWQQIQTYKNATNNS